MNTRLVSFLILISPIGPILAAAEPAEKKPAPAASNPSPANPQPDKPSPPPGHSLHGEAFNEGPRQAAYLMQGVGKVKFPVTTDKPDCQAFINQGVAQLHGFWYFEAERSFRQAAKIDPKCAMAYWGMAWANINNEKRAKEFAAEALKRKEGLSEREKLYLESLDNYVKFDAGKKKERSEALIRNLEKIVYAAPEDIEAKAFLALHIWLGKEAGVPVQSYVAVNALLEEVFRVEPMHPAHHYRIHLWDAEKAENSLKSAALCGQTAPGIAHMWHMGGHIFSDVKRYDVAAWQQEASARVDHAHMIRDRVLPDQIHNFAHNNEWLIRDLNHIGRAHDAVSLAKNMIEAPQHPKYNILSKQGSAHYGRQRLFETLAKFELWDELVLCCRSGYLEPTDDAAEQVKRLRYLGSGLARSGKLDEARQVLKQLADQLSEKKTKADQAGAAAREQKILEYRGEKEAEKAAEEARKPLLSGSSDLEKAQQELEGWLANAAGDFKSALTKLNQAGGVDQSALCRIKFQAGEKEPALQEARKHATDSKNQVLPLATLVELLAKTDKKDETAKAFAELRELAATADLDAPPLARLSPLAAELKFPADWRLPKTPPADVGVRPALDSLGPFRWHPSPAPNWSLADDLGQTHTLAEHRGRPLVLIFFLGHGCLHCAQQLQAFAPKLSEFQAAGLDVWAISSDEPEGLKKSIENYKPGKMPIPLFSDPSLAAFKSYRAFDDFENRPLHGTFVIDGEGLVRWQDIGFEPFSDPKFVLAEARRLLAQPKPAIPARLPAAAAAQAKP